MAQIVEATAAQAIPYPTAQREAALSAIARYLAMLRGWTETRFGVVGDGVGNKDVADRVNFVYARMGDANGEVCEARNILMLNMAEGDPVLLARERPGGLGGWLVVEWYGQTTPPVVMCEGDSLFWINLDNWAIFRVDSVSASASSGVIVNTDLQLAYTLMWLASGGTNKVSILLDDGDNSLGTSIDGGATFSISPQGDNNNSWYSYWRTMEADLSNANFLWAAMPSYYDPYPSGGFYSVLYSSSDGGINWGRSELVIYAVGYSSGGEVAAPRHDGSNAFVITSEVLRASPHTTKDVYLWLVGDDPTAGLYNFTAAQIAMLPAANGQPFWGCTRYGDTDNFYFLPYYEMRLFRFTWSTKTLTDLGLVNGIPGGNYQKQIVSTRQGTLLISASPFGGTPFLYVYRSTDGGVSWTQIDLTALIPTARAQDTWDYIAIGKNDTLVIPIQGDASDGYDGYLLFSTDDGATWQRTNVFIPMAYYGRPIDICGEGL